MRGLDEQAARERLIAYLCQAGLSAARANAVLDGYTHELAEKIRRGRWDWPNDFDEEGRPRPAYRRAWDDGMTKAADLIDPVAM
jgi:hypothetical protein